MDGNVLYGFDNDKARSVASVMLGRSIEVLDELVVSAIEELADLISGNAANRTGDGGLSQCHQPPMMYQSAGLGFTPIKVKQIQVDFVSSLGSLHVRIGLSERLGRSQEVSWLQMQH